MTRRSSARRIDRATSGAIDFDAALEAYLDGSDPAAFLLRASSRWFSNANHISPITLRTTKATKLQPSTVYTIEAPVCAAKREIAGGRRAVR